MDMLFGLIGYPISHSLSPYIHRKFMDECGLKGEYRLFECVANPVSELRKLRELGVCGLNVTAPYKREILEGLYGTDELSARICAVNTLRLEKSGYIGYNTDVRGIAAAIEAFGRSFRSAVILGAGGAASAAAVAAECLADTVYTVYIVGRDAAKAKTLAGSIKNGVARGVTDTVPGELCINCVPADMSLANFPKLEALIDLRYHPRETELMARAKARGIATQNGLTTLVWQAAASFEIWTGKKPCAQRVLDLLNHEHTI